MAAHEGGRGEAAQHRQWGERGLFIHGAILAPAVRRREGL
ncbi:hypothetical protein RA210_U60235 [Rubrivivax sp. A210]|nr:hypothetical protein RA210_U60235 [Rubrivivax sp. A210]